MAVQATRHPSHAAFPDEFTWCASSAGVGMVDTTRLRDFPRSDYGLFELRSQPREPARVLAAAATGDGFVEGALMQMPVAPCGALASTSGRPADGFLPSRMYDAGADIDALITLESERMRAGLEDARRRHLRAVVAAVERAAWGRLRAAEAELERALRRNAELEDRARQAATECHAWMGVARSHEAVAAGLRATLDQLLLHSPRAAAVADGHAEDAQSCCFEASAADAKDEAARQSTRAPATSCGACRGGEACVLVLPCRHLCLCRSCEPAVEACPVCAAAKNASLHILLC